MQSIDQNEDKTNGIRVRIKEMEEINRLSTICSSPKSLKIEVSASCNLACHFCYHRQCGRNGLMTKDDFYKAIQVAADYKIPQVGLLFLGEPTMNDLLPEFVTIAKNEFHIPYVFITTNGVTSEDMIRRLMNSPLDSLKWSVNQPNRERFFKENGVDGFDTQMRNIKLAAALDKHTKLYASSAVYDVDHVEPEMTKFIDLEVKPYVYEHYYFKLNNQGGLIQDEHFHTIHCNRLPIIPCPRLFNNSYITYDLKVALCCSAFTDDFLLGDLRKESFESIWNGKKMQELRMAHLSGDVSKTICGGYRQ